jgi:hypothetical protein
LNLWRHAQAASFIAALLVCLPALTATPARDKSVWNYDGGIVLVTDGSIADGPCFRIAGRVSAPKFFDNLKRVDTGSGAVFRRGTDTLDTFPDQLTLGFIVHDHPCSTDLQNGFAHGYLTRQQMRSLKLDLYWKRGVELRRVSGVEPKYFSVDPVATHPVGPAIALQERLVWSYEFAVASAGVPLTDSLVLIFRSADGRIAARVAARM